MYCPIKRGQYSVKVKYLCELFNLLAINKSEAFVANHGLITIDYGFPRLFFTTFHLILQVVEPGCVAINDLRIGAV